MVQAKIQIQRYSAIIVAVVKLAKRVGGPIGAFFDRRAWVPPQPEIDRRRRRRDIDTTGRVGDGSALRRRSRGRSWRRGWRTWAVRWRPGRGGHGRRWRWRRGSTLRPTAERGVGRTRRQWEQHCEAELSRGSWTKLPTASRPGVCSSFPQDPHCLYPYFCSFYWYLDHRYLYCQILPPAFMPAVLAHLYFVLMYTFVLIAFVLVLYQVQKYVLPIRNCTWRTGTCTCTGTWLDDTCANTSENVLLCVTVVLIRVLLSVLS